MLLVHNINSKFINNTHYIYTHKIYRCYIRHLLPLKDGTISDNLYNNYFLEGNSFIDKSSFYSGINNINIINDISKTHIGTNDTNLYIILIYLFMN